MAQTANKKKPGPKPGTKRKTSYAGKTGGSRSVNNSKKTQKSNWSNEVRNELLLIVLFAICVLLFLCNFNLIGPVGSSISKFTFGVVGLLSYVTPIAIFLVVAFGTINKGNKLATKKIFLSIIIYIIVGIFLQLITGTMHDLENIINEDGFFEVVKALYSNSALTNTGGGVIFGGFAFLLFHFIGLLGTIIVSLIILIVCIVLLTEKAIIHSFKEKSNQFISDMRIDANRRKEEQEVRREELEKQREQLVAKQDAERILRMDKKVSGVMLDTTIQKEETNKATNDIHEINLVDEKTGEMDLEKIKIRGIRPIDEIIIHQGIEEIREISGHPGILPIVSGTESVEEDKLSVQSYRTRAIQREKNNFNEYDSGKEEIEIDMTSRENMQIKAYRFPALSLLKKTEKKYGVDSTRQLKETAMRLQSTLENFGVNVTITDISQGPAVTRYELQPEQGVKVSRIVALADDIKLNLAATDIRIEAPIPGKAAVGIEVPNKENSTVGLRELLESPIFKEFPSKLCFAVGKDIGGDIIISDISKMPHMLIAGATGSGKSVCINTIIMSILYKAHPDEVKMIMIDPKVVELSVYNGIPHLLIPVVTDPKKASAALHWAVTEMTDRYKKFADMNVRDLKGYNKKIESSQSESVVHKLPQILIIVDELADLMMVAPSEVEEAICRLAQLARAAGIHLIIATQRPSVDVITGLIKANMPSRLAFAVSSGVDSRTILDMNGAEKLLGKGDMLFYPQGFSKPARIQGTFVSDREVSDVVDFLKNQALGNVYSQDIENQISTIKTNSLSVIGNNQTDERDMYFEEAGRFIIEKEKASIGMLQRVFKIGFNRAARIMDQLCELGVVGEEEGTKPRKVLMTLEEFLQYTEEDVSN